MDSGSDSDDLGMWEHKYTIGGVDIKIREDWEAGLGGTLWDGSHLLSQYMAIKEDFPEGFFKGKRVMEIGAGTGLPGIVAGTLGADAIITDLEISVELLAENAVTNKSVITGSVVAKAHPWGTDVSEFNPPFDILLAADVVYEIEGVNLLLESMKALTDTNTLILLAHFPRVPAASQVFWQQMPLYFDVEKVPDELLDLGEMPTTSGVFRLKKRETPLSGVEADDSEKKGAEAVEVISDEEGEE